MNRILTIAFLFFLYSCGNDDINLTSVDEEIQSWLDTLNVSASRGSSGIYTFADSLNPSGTQASSGAVAAIYYTLQDLNGNVIASHQRADGDSLIFKIGASAVYPVGLDIAITSMRVGEIFNFIIPPSLAYPYLTTEAINPNLIAHLIVDLRAIHNEDDLFTQSLADIDNYISDNDLNNTAANPLDPVEQFPSSGISYKRLSSGSGGLPINGDTVIVNYRGRFLDNSTFASDTDFEWIYGSNEPRELLTGFEFGISLMQQGEDALIFLPSSAAYRESALIIPQSISNNLVEDGIIPDYVTSVPPYSTIIFEISRVN